MQLFITACACGVIFACCLIGTFSQKFDDTFIQRCVFALGAVFSLGVAKHALSGQEMPEAVQGLIGCFAIHSMEVVRKIRKRNKQTAADEFGKTTILRLADIERAKTMRQIRPMMDAAKDVAEDIK